MKTKTIRFSNNEVSVNCLYMVTDDSGMLVMASFFDRSQTVVGQVDASIKAASKKGASMSARYTTENYSYERRKNVVIYRGSSYTSYRCPVPFGHDRACVSFVTNDAIGTDYIITSSEFAEDDIYSYLMNSFTLPIKREWVPYIRENLVASRDLQLIGDSCVLAPEDATFEVHGKKIGFADLVLYRTYADEATIERIISTGIRAGAIRVCDKPQRKLDLGEKSEDGKYNLDRYMEKYGASLSKRVDANIDPLVPLIPVVNGYAGKRKRIYPQQAAVVNGMIALRNSGEKFGFMTCGMGCGKTIMAIAAIEGSVNGDFLKRNPDMTLKDMYQLPKEKQPSYRAVVMPPGHLLEKWKREILLEVPDAKVRIIRELSDLEDIRKEGREPNGRQWYIIGKDFAKLDSGMSPIPTKMVYAKPGFMICDSCHKTGSIHMVTRDRKGRGYCPGCGTTDKKEFTYYVPFDSEEENGLLCPSCGHLLITKKAKMGEKGIALSAVDFADKNSDNDFCRHCGASLWGYRVKPNDGHKENLKWLKLSYKPNKNGKGSVKTSYVLKGKDASGNDMVYQFMQKKGLIDVSTGEPAKVHEVKLSEQQYYPRKVSPASFIKKYLRNFWDFVVLDEVHKYAGAGTGQMTAAHALVKSVKSKKGFTLGLTGTLTNGKADSLYYLLWMLIPRKLREKGFSFSSSSEFSKQYGCVEVVYEHNGVSNYGKLRKGRVLTSPSTKPGISPLVFKEFLVGHSCCLDLSDLSNKMPALNEYVEIVDLPADVGKGYNDSLKMLQLALKDIGGHALLGDTLNFALSYPDKPYGRLPIANPKTGSLVCNPANLDNYKSGLLPKEERLVEIIKREIADGRNCFVFAQFTGKEETCVTKRLKYIIERECNLRGRVAILEAVSPKAEKREEYIHSLAENGMQVVITNPKVCETGLDFCWEAQSGKFYNYPTICFYQIGYELSVMLQASRRHYRLNQTEECRTYWMCYDGTLQAAALQILGAKQVASAAIQGRFSAEGIASMAQGIDPRVELAKKLSSNDNSSREELCGMFDVLAKSSQTQDDADCELQPLYFEIMGEKYSDEVLEAEFDVFDLIELPKESVRELAEGATQASEGATQASEDAKPQKAVEEHLEAIPEIEIADALVPSKKTKGRKKDRFEGSVSLFDELFEIKEISISGIEPFDVISKKKAVKVCEAQCDLLSLLVS